MEDLVPGPSICDGAWGTELQALGLAAGECPDAWNLSHADRVEAVARSYVEAGSEIILTNTFGANRLLLASHGLADQAADINRSGARISRRAASDRARVFASMGPTGKMLAMGETDEAELYAVYQEQAQALAGEGVDGLVLETFTDLNELRPALGAAKATGLPVVACMVFDSGPARDRTMMGTTPEHAAAALVEAGADAIGANCGRGIAGYIPVCGRLRAATDLPLWLKPNAGLPEVVEGRSVYRMSPGEFAEKTRDLVQAGAVFVGGCCGTTPEFIAAIVKAIKG
ncbi:MAG: homocysteine S-methyltransferase family protein [Vicinamibacteria bacterium]|nr:homocysteine S-methyltransferase family protein [Vicinamibacteria bacterium]